jgi:hypothetical protein
MYTTIIIAVVVLAIALACGLIALNVARRGRSGWLREHFGPEYKQALEQFGRRDVAEAALDRRRKEEEDPHVRHLRPEEKELFAGRWHDIQARFNTDPRGAIDEADALIREAIRTRRYPAEQLEGPVDDVSVDSVVRNYRIAREITQTGSRRKSVEELRRALLYYRAAFEELVEMQAVD